MCAKLPFTLALSALSISLGLGLAMEAVHTEVVGDSGLVRLANTGYSVGLSKVNYFQASLNCRQNNLFLVSIESLQEQTALEGLIHQYGLENDNFWTSGTDLAYEGYFFWASTGLPLTYRYFDVGEPNSAGDEDCVQMRGGTYAFKWNDISCVLTNFYICEKL